MLRRFVVSPDQENNEKSINDSENVLKDPTTTAALI